ncbi:hypothetical protein QY049_03920 [Bradyrhizobium sp. WYCCWR 13022]|uniref:hypothetical protein n=1 Tax=unclassified Bradyrhizobium TaxID=2631580 RepID=UPI00263B7F31|nr:hypothetical protein [Bradyrhizobium sp. WYCCWR 13022]MDN4982370.1 hypothetical protein [Bradyrhizobium sp. WYCCWR 13022]
MDDKIRRHLKANGTWQQIAEGIYWHNWDMGNEPESLWHLIGYLLDKSAPRYQIEAAYRLAMKHEPAHPLRGAVITRARSMVRN